MGGQRQLWGYEITRERKGGRGAGWARGSPGQAGAEGGKCHGVWAEELQHESSLYLFSCPSLPRPQFNIARNQLIST